MYRFVKGRAEKGSSVAERDSRTVFSVWIQLLFTQFFGNVNAASTSWILGPRLPVVLLLNRLGCEVHRDEHCIVLFVQLSSSSSALGSIGINTDHLIGFGNWPNLSHKLRCKGMVEQVSYIGP